MAFKYPTVIKLLLLHLSLTFKICWIHKVLHVLHSQKATSSYSTDEEVGLFHLFMNKFFFQKVSWSWQIKYYKWREKIKYVITNYIPPLVLNLLCQHWNWTKFMTYGRNPCLKGKGKGDVQRLDAVTYQWRSLYYYSIHRVVVR